MYINGGELTGRQIADTKAIIELLGIDPVCIEQSPYGGVNIWMSQVEKWPGECQYKHKIEFVAGRFLLAEWAIVWEYDLPGDWYSVLPSARKPHSEAQLHVG
jgi:hypothetical protein